MAEKTVRIKVPEILKARGLNAYDLMYGSRINLNTAKRWADTELAKGITRIDLIILVNIANYLEVDDIADLLEIVDDE